MFIQTFSLPNLCEVCIFKATMYFSRMNRANYLFLLSKLPWQPSQLAFSGLKIFHSLFIMGAGGKKERKKKKTTNPCIAKTAAKIHTTLSKVYLAFSPTYKTSSVWLIRCLTNFIFMKIRHVHSLRSWKAQCSQFIKSSSYDQFHYCLTSWQITSITKELILAVVINIHPVYLNFH